MADLSVNENQTSWFELSQLVEDSDNSLAQVQLQCQNCGQPCGGTFCCDWCMDAFLARQEAHGGRAATPNAAKDRAARCESSMTAKERSACSLQGLRKS